MFKGVNKKIDASVLNTEVLSDSKNIVCNDMSASKRTGFTHDVSFGNGLQWCSYLGRYKPHLGQDWNFAVGLIDIDLDLGNPYNFNPFNFNPFNWGTGGTGGTGGGWYGGRETPPSANADTYKWYNVGCCIAQRCELLGKVLGFDLTYLDDNQIEKPIPDSWKPDWGLFVDWYYYFVTHNCFYKRGSEAVYPAFPDPDDLEWTDWEDFIDDIGVGVSWQYKEHIEAVRAFQFTSGNGNIDIEGLRGYQYPSKRYYWDDSEGNTSNFETLEDAKNNVWSSYFYSDSWDSILSYPRIRCYKSKIHIASLGHNSTYTMTLTVNKSVKVSFANSKTRKKANGVWLKKGDVVSAGTTIYSYGGGISFSSVNGDVYRFRATRNGIGHTFEPDYWAKLFIKEEKLFIKFSEKYYQNFSGDPASRYVYFNDVHNKGYKKDEWIEIEDEIFKTEDIHSFENVPNDGLEYGYTPYSKCPIYRHGFPNDQYLTNKWYTNMGISNIHF